MVQIRKLRWSLLVMALPLMAFAQRQEAPKLAVVEITTEKGRIVVALYNETPLHRDNFLKLVREGAYDSLLWHRVIPRFMIQGGDPGSRHAEPNTALGSGGPGYTIPSEIIPGLVHKKGALAAARQGDQVNPERRSSGSQFYIVQGTTYQPTELDAIAERAARMGTTITYAPEQIAYYASHGGAPHLDGGYTVFGEVIEGLDVIDRIASVERDARDRPLEDIHIFMRVIE